MTTGSTRFESRLLTTDTKPNIRLEKYKVVSFKTNIFPSELLETAKIRNMRIINNYDLGIPKKEISEGDHHCTEYFEADDNKDLIKKEVDDAEDNGPGTFNTFLGLIPLKCLQL